MKYKYTCIQKLTLIFENEKNISQEKKRIPEESYSPFSKFL